MVDNLWERYAVGRHVRAILATFAGWDNTPQFGRPFLTSYQLAIAFNQRAPELRREQGWPVGGKDVGRHTSLAQYLARELTRRIREERITDIECGLLADRHITAMSFDNGIKPTWRQEFTMFRLRSG